MAEAEQDGEFSISYDDGLMFERRSYVPVDNAVKTELLTKAHSLPFSMHPGSTKMYQDLKSVYWWRNMKREVTDFISRCLVCPQVKAPRQKPAVVNRLTKSAHFIPGKPTYTAKMLVSLQSFGNDFILPWARAIRLPLAWHRLKLCMVGVVDLLYVKVAPMKGVLRFEKKGKLSPLHVSHVSMLRKYLADPTHIVDFEPLQINENLSYKEQPVEILAREVMMLGNRGIALVKVLWRNNGVAESTWEREDNMRAQYPELFED
ncbi:ty3-gypsy retrotransposon protein [Cucumis melo var. makuwa]|uniref:Ty3-gypsy retrotransposon protein n=1 Tax=Cucumis melo var. makuwa TaxID=1194695 RepID=A0A5D3DTA0_CUCMM|nr:ty3-gypsy retrotransposon protein [Cucumis melo var. makuwa]TYK26758.1 ty3-gypsy retrotransposon protein [Cucumis melo var. makuwa]